MGDSARDPAHSAFTDGWPVSREDMLAADCLFGVDQVRGRPDVTEFKRHARWHQAQWRVTQGLPIGSHYAERLNGSRIQLDAAIEAGSNFLSDDIRSAVDHRLANPERHQMLDERRLWSDLLSSMPMCFNLFGEAAVDQDRLRNSVDTLWPNHPGTAAELRFEWSPGRRDRRYLSNRTAFDAAVLLDLDGEGRGVIGIETKYHEHIKRERAPHEVRRLPRYREVTEASGAFKPGWEEALIGTDLQQIWLDHLLVLAMLEPGEPAWAWGKFALVYPAANPSVRDAAKRYQDVLADDSTFQVRTIEELLSADVLHAPATAIAFRKRYLW